MQLKGRNFLKLMDYTPEEITYLIDLSQELKEKKKKGIRHDDLTGKNIALIFEKTSTRTRCSFEVAAHDLGMHVTYLDPSGSQIGKKESIADTARVLGRMFDGIEYRGYGQEIVEELAKYVGGIAYLDGQPVTVIGVHKGKDLEDCAKRNYGMPSPEGYRKALRLMKQAEKFNRPIITFVNTSGAYPGMEAEENGQGEAIARNLYEMSSIKVPILCLMIGEGGSGGALALSVGNEVWMMENATYSILSPEGFASILWKDGKRAKEAAEVMKITAHDLKELDVVDDIIPEFGGADEDALSSIGNYMKGNMKKFLEKESKLTKDQLLEERYKRFRKF